MKNKGLLVILIAVFSLGGCVESSQKYKTLLVKANALDSIQQSQNTELESLLSALNEITVGMQSLREAENMLKLESKESIAGSKSQEQVNQLKSDIQAISEAIAGYKEQIKNLESRNKRQSAELKKMIAGLNEELEASKQKIDEFSAQLAEKEKQLAAKDSQINSLNQDVATLNRETESQKATITGLDHSLHQAYYFVGTRKELKNAHIIIRQGIFCPPIVSAQAQQAAFIPIDMRNVKTIPLKSDKAKILSVHPENSYSLDKDEKGNPVLNIKDESNFWKQSKYLVVMN